MGSGLSAVTGSSSATTTAVLSTRKMTKPLPGTNGTTGAAAPGAARFWAARAFALVARVLRGARATVGSLPPELLSPSGGAKPAITQPTTCDLDVGASVPMPKHSSSSRAAASASSSASEASVCEVETKCTERISRGSLAWVSGRLLSTDQSRRTPPAAAAYKGRLACIDSPHAPSTEPSTKGIV